SWKDLYLLNGIGVGFCSFIVPLSRVRTLDQHRKTPRRVCCPIRTRRGKEGGGTCVPRFHRRPVASARPTSVHIIRPPRRPRPVRAPVCQRRRPARRRRLT